MERDRRIGSNGNRWWLVLLILPFIATLWVPFYARYTPKLGAIPFFYWYQFLWVIITVTLTGIVYALYRD